ncbi:AC4 protein [Begomovirus paulistiensis]|nr:AC4 protein [Begomovirus paulistiensis]UWJ07349.1 AC4 protein [Begomovirus paulistiensis]
MLFFRCFKISNGQSSDQHTSELPERNTPMADHIYTVSSNFPGNRTSRMLDFSTSLTPEGLPLFTQMSRQPKTPTPSRTTSPKRVTIVNPDGTRCLGEQREIKTMSTTTQLMHQLQQKLWTL